MVSTLRTILSGDKLFETIMEYHILQRVIFEVNARRSQTIAFGAEAGTRQVQQRHHSDG
jgi:hypothetical protein